MAFPTAINDQITDAVTQNSVTVIADAPAVAVANLQQAIAHALALAAENATNAQQQNNILAQAVSACSAQLLDGGR